MSEEKAKDIDLEYLPNPEGDNSFEVKINEGSTTLKYFANNISGGQLVNAGDVALTFSNCISVNYQGSEPNEETYPGWNNCKSDLCEVINSKWLKLVVPNTCEYRHFVFALYHQLFECLAKSYEASTPT